MRNVHNVFRAKTPYSLLLIVRLVKWTLEKVHPLILSFLQRRLVSPCCIPLPSFWQTFILRRVSYLRFRRVLHTLLFLTEPLVCGEYRDPTEVQGRPEVVSVRECECFTEVRSHHLLGTKAE